ncbi:hypothetical protein BDZ97DRAFT_328448 [Flammula alnicola]|nr:hypothetical protein BDZ97DRAFT_328448 [Flammula alnicola]
MSSRQFAYRIASHTLFCRLGWKEKFSNWILGREQLPLGVNLSRGFSWEGSVGHSVAGRPRSDRHILTLSPERMPSVGQQIIDLSDISLPLHYIGPKEESVRLAFQASHKKNKLQTFLPYPPKTRGAFYYHQDPGRPALSGELRFRMCNSIAKFHMGQDLQVDVGEPWNIPLLTMVQKAPFLPICRLLTQDGLVDDDLVADLQKLPHLYRHTKESIMLYEIDQPFVVDVARSQWAVSLVTRKSLQTVVLQKLFRAQTGKFTPLYTGRVRARFEASTLPEHAHRPALVLRVLEELTPVKCVVPDYDGFVAKPRPGELFAKKYRQMGYVPWSYSLSNRVYSKTLAEFIRLTGTKS